MEYAPLSRRCLITVHTPTSLPASPTKRGPSSYRKIAEPEAELKARQLSDASPPSKKLLHPGYQDQPLSIQPPPPYIHPKRSSSLKIPAPRTIRPSTSDGVVILERTSSLGATQGRCKSIRRSGLANSTSVNASLATNLMRTPTKLGSCTMGNTDDAVWWTGGSSPPQPSPPPPVEISTATWKKEDRYNDRNEIKTLSQTDL